MSFWKSDWELVAIVLIASSCSVAEAALTGSRSAECVKAGGTWRQANGCAADYCEAKPEKSAK